MGKREINELTMKPAILSLSTRTTIRHQIFFFFVKGLHMKLNEVFICHNTHFSMMLRQRTHTCAPPSSPFVLFFQWRHINALESNLCIVHKLSHNILARMCDRITYYFFGWEGGRGEMGEKFGLRLLMASIKIELEWGEKSFFYDCVH